ncbi:MAG: phosphotransferase family protein [Planctomycetota bacterium]|jgi:aminoglycoside phosphotransferase (APT) family kinase protein
MERRAPKLDLSILQVREMIALAVPGVVVNSFKPVEHGRVNTNINVKTDYGHMLLRVNTRRPETSDKEVAINRLVKETVSVPKVMGTGSWNDHRFAVYEFIDAPVMLEAEVTDWSELGKSIGKTLAAVWSYSFDTSGDLNVVKGSLAVTDWGLGDDPVRKFCYKCLFDSPCGERLGNDLRDRTWELLRDSDDRWPEEKTTPHLSHGDFNPTNILIQNNNVAAVLDWEFANSGDKYGDLGNLFRRRDELLLPDEFLDSVVESLEESGVSLPDDWQQRTLLSDLTSAIEFLSSKEDRPKTHARAKNQVENTLVALA